MLIAMNYLYSPMLTMKYLYSPMMTMYTYVLLHTKRNHPFTVLTSLIFGALYQSACDAPPLLASKAIDRGNDFCLFLHRG